LGRKKKEAWKKVKERSNQQRKEIQLIPENIPIEISFHAFIRAKN